MDKQLSLWDRAKAVLADALDLPEPEQDAFVRVRCGGDTALLGEVESLLAASRSSGGLLVRETDAWLGVGPNSGALEPGATIGGYSIERVLAEGPSAVVYLATHGATHRRVAVKLFRGALPLVGSADRFRLEAAAAARVEHPNVARLYEAGVFEGEHGARLPYLAMELVEGPTISEYVRSRGLGADAVVGLVIRVCGGVQAIHQRAVIHRDLKPSNILVAQSGEPKVLDFGVARLDFAPDVSWSTGDGAVLGTPGYMSPEQAENPRNVDVRTDVWALGVITHELLAGRSPFNLGGMSPLQALRHAATAEALPLPDPVRNARGGDLARVVAKAMAREPADRYPTVQAFEDDLSAVLEGRPVSARRRTLTYRAAKFTRRRAIPLAIGAAFAALVVAAAGSQIAAWRGASLERDRAVAVVGVLRDMISAASPEFGNRNVRMLDALTGIEQRLGAGMPEQPLVEAEIRSLLARLNFALGDYDKAGVHAVRAIELRRRHAPGDPGHLIADRALYANILRWQYQPERATREATEATDEATRRLGAGHPATLDAKEAWAGTLHDAGDLQAAERAYRGIVGLRERTQGSADERTLVSKASLASVLADLARYAEAEAINRNVLERRAARAQTLEALTVRGNLARVVAEQGRLDEAVSLLVDLDRDARTALGPVHEVTLTARTNLVEFLRRQGRSEEAVRCSGELLEQCAGALGWGHDRTLAAFTGHTTLLLRAGLTAEARLLAERAVGSADQVLPAGSVWRPRVRATLAAALAGERRFSEAIPLYREVVAALTTTLGSGHRVTLQTRNNLALALIDSGDPAAAIAELDPTLRSILESGFVEMEAVVRRNLGRALLDAGRPEGVEMLTLAYELSVRRQELDNARQCATLLASHYGARQGPESEDWRRRSIEPARLPARP